MSVFPLPLVFAAWGTDVQGEYEHGTGRLRDHALAAGVKTVALQVSRVRAAEQVSALQDAGLVVVGWDEASRVSKQRFAALGFDGYVPQVESPGQYASALASLKMGVGAGLPKAVVSTYWGLFNPATPRDGLLYAALQREGVSGCLVECYSADDPTHAELDRMLNQGEVYGIPAADLIPMCGVYRGELPPVYSGLSTKGRAFALYLAEAMSDTQWTAWGGVNRLPQVYYWRLMAGASQLHEERATTYSKPGVTPVDDGLGRMLAWMVANKKTVRNANGMELVRVLAASH